MEPMAGPTGSSENCSTMEFPTLAYENEISAFLGVSARPATAEEASTWGPDEIDEPVLVYESPTREGRRVKLLYVDSLERVQVELYVGDRRVTDYTFSGARVLLEPGGAHLIVFSGSSVLHIGKISWDLSASQSDFYKNTDWDSSEPW